MDVNVHRSRKGGSCLAAEMTTVTICWPTRQIGSAVVVAAVKLEVRQRLPKSQRCRSDYRLWRSGHVPGSGSFIAQTLNSVKPPGCRCRYSPNCAAFSRSNFSIDWEMCCGRAYHVRNSALGCNGNQDNEFAVSQLFPTSHQGHKGKMIATLDVVQGAVEMKLIPFGVPGRVCNMPLSINLGS